MTGLVLIFPMVYNVSDLMLCALQLVRECKEVLKGGLLMKQYYQFMLRGVVTDAQGMQTNANIDEFEEDLHKMLVVSLPGLPLPLLKATDVLNSRLQGCGLLHN